MKRIIVFMLAMVMILCLEACVESPAEMPGETPAASNTETANKEDVSIEKEEPVETEPVRAEITFTEQNLVDDENCTVTVTGIEEDAIWGYTLKVLLENKTDLDLMYTVESVSVNGFMCDPFWASSVTAQMKSNEEISFSSEAFERNGIDVPTDISFTLRVYDDNDWTADALVEQEFTVYPMGEKAVQPYERQAGPEDVVLCDDEYCTMIVTGFETDEIWGYTMNVYLENKTDTELMFSADGVAVNGFMCDPFWAESVAAGKRSNTGLSWSDEAFAENGITEVTEIVLPVRVYDNENWSADAFVEETFTVNP